MGVRDLEFWTLEARRRVLTRRVETFNTALLPWQKPSVIRSEKDALMSEISTLEYIEHAGEVKAIERASEAAIAAFEERKASRRKDKKPRARRRALKPGAAGREF